MIDRLLLLGATGDLAARFLFPALAELCAVGDLPETFEIVGAAREKMSDDAFPTGRLGHSNRRKPRCDSGPQPKPRATAR